MFASRITSLRARLSARLARSLALAGVAAATLATAACSSDRLTAPRGPTTAAQLSVSDSMPSTVRVEALLRTTPLAENVTRSFTVRRNGGSGEYKWPEMGLTVLVPDKSFPQKAITITITALAGSVVAYEFGPEGQQFSEPLTIVQSLKETNYAKARNGYFRGAYFKNVWDLNQMAGTAAVSEFQPTEMDLQGGKVTFKVKHFSGYMVSMD